MFRILNLVQIYLGKNEAYAFWKKSCTYIGSDAWKEILLRNRPFYIEQLIFLLKEISPEDELESDRFKFLLDNFYEIYKDSNLHRLEELFKHLPPSTALLLQNKMEPNTFASKIVESEPKYLDLIMRKLEDEFMRNVFNDLNKNKWPAFVNFLKKLTGETYPKSLVERINAINNIDKEFADTVQKILKGITSPVHHDKNGIIIINNKDANGYSNNEFSNHYFRKHLSNNFGNNFICNISNEKILYRLIKKIYDSTYDYPENEQGSEIIGRVVYQLPDDMIKECCMNEKMMVIIEKTNNAAYKYLCKKFVAIG